MLHAVREAVDIQGVIQYHARVFRSVLRPSIAAAFRIRGEVQRDVEIHGALAPERDLRLLRPGHALPSAGQSNTRFGSIDEAPVLKPRCFDVHRRNDLKRNIGAFLPFEHIIGFRQHIHDILAADGVVRITVAFQRKTISHGIAGSDDGIIVRVQHVLRRRITLCLHKALVKFDQRSVAPGDGGIDSVIRPVVHPDDVAQRIADAGDAQILHSLIADALPVMPAVQMGKVPLDLRVDAGIAVSGRSLLLLRVRSGHGDGSGGQPVFLIVLADHDVCIFALRQDIVGDAARYLRFKPLVCKAGVHIRPYKQILAPVEIVHHGQVVVFTVSIMGEIQLIVQHRAVRYGVAVQFCVVLVIDALADDGLPMGLSLRRGALLHGFLPVRLADQLCRVYDANRLRGGILARPVLRQHPEGVLCGCINHEGVLRALGNGQHFRLALIQCPLAGIGRVHGDGVARALQRLCRGCAGIGAAIRHGDGIAVLGLRDSEGLTARADIAVAGGAVGGGFVDCPRDLLPFREGRVRDGDGQVRAVGLIEHSLHVLRRYIAVFAQSVPDKVAFLLARPVRETAVFQRHRVGDVLAEIVAALRTLGECQRTLLRRKGSVHAGGQRIVRAVGIMNRRVRRIGQRRAVLGESSQIGFQRLRVDGDGASAGTQLRGGGGVGVLPAKHKIFAIRAQSRPAAGPVGTGDGGDFDVSGVNIVAAGADAAALCSIQNRLRPMKSRRKRKLIGEIHRLRDVLAVGGGRIRVSVQLDVPDKAARGSGRTVCGGGDAGGVRAAQGLFQRIRVALRFPEGFYLYIRFADARLVCRLVGCQNLAPDGKTAARAGGGRIHGCHGEAQRIADAGNELQIHGVRIIRRVACHRVAIKGIALTGADIQDAVRRAFLEIHTVDILGASGCVARGRRDGHGVARQDRVATGAVLVFFPLERFALGGDLDLKIRLVGFLQSKVFASAHAVLAGSAAGGTGQAGVVKDAVALCRVGEGDRSLLHGRFAVHTGEGRAVGKTVRADLRDGGRSFKGNARQRSRQRERVRAHGSDRTGHAILRGDGRGDGHARDIPRNIDELCRTCCSIVGIHHALTVHIHRAAKAGQRRGSARECALGNGDLVIRLKDNGGRVVYKVGEALGERIHLIADGQREGGVRAAGVRRGGGEGRAFRVIAQSLQPHHGAVGQVRLEACYTVGDLKVC